jgi:hypothetical protein
MQYHAAVCSCQWNVVPLFICLVDSVIMDASPIENRLRKSFTINKEKTTLQDHFMANKVVKMCINANFLFEVYFLGEMQCEAGSLW